MPKVHVNDTTYLKLKELAEEQNRPVANMLDTILVNVWGKQPANPLDRLKHPSAELAEPKFDVKAEPKKDAFDALKQAFGVTLCKHGASPELCKHAKIVNGKKACK